VSTRPKPQTTTGGTAEYLTAGQIAELLQVSEKSVYRWAAGDPTFPMLKIRGTVRFPRERLIRWLLEREQGFGRRRMRKRVLPAAKSRPGGALPRRRERQMISNSLTARSAQG
jgi:excisionase family DNA binding protein